MNLLVYDFQTLPITIVYFGFFFSSGFGIRMSSTSFGPCMHTCFPVSNEEAQSSIMILIDFYWM